MSIAIVCRNKDPGPWLRAIHAVDSSIEVQLWPAEHQCDKVAFVLCWRQPEGVFDRYPQLKCICSMGAGVDTLIQDPSLPRHLPLLRLVDPKLSQSMFAYIAGCALDFLRQSAAYRQQQANRDWQPLAARAASDVRIGVMGLGEIGAEVATKLVSLGFQVAGWSRTKKALPALRHCYAGELELRGFLAQSDILVCLLPLTDHTRGILCAETFDNLPAGACLINVARGEHAIESEVLLALDKGQLAAAYLDVFRHEPLPSEHPFWLHPKVSLTPHVASVTDPVSVAPQIVENYRRMQSGQPLKNVVEVQRGY